jgi:hypothetical protein
VLALVLIILCSLLHFLQPSDCDIIICNCYSSFIWETNERLWRFNKYMRSVLASQRHGLKLVLAPAQEDV